MNQGKLEVEKQEMARMNVNILGISQLKWTGMDEFNSDDHFIYYCGQESLRKKVGSQETPGVTGKFGLGIQNEAGQRLIEFCQENALVIANTLFQQHKKRFYTWTSPDSQSQNQLDYILHIQRWRIYTVSKNKTRS